MATGQDRPIELSVVIPAFNERERLPNYLSKIERYLSAVESYEVIVVDDGSRDGTGDWVDDRARTWPRLICLRLPKNRGKGAAVRAGALAAVGQIVLVADADGATPIEELHSLRQALDKGADVACGSRLSSLRPDRSPLRRLAAAAFAMLVAALARPRVRDTQCGFKLFRASAARRLFSLSSEDGWAYDVEILVLADLLGIRAQEVAVAWNEVDGSKVRVWRDGASMARKVVGLRGKLQRRLRLSDSAVGLVSVR